MEPERGWILMGTEPREVESMCVCEGLYLSTSPNLLRRLLKQPPPPRTRLLTGYAGWGAGQLDAELSASVWLTTQVNLDIIFNTPVADMWETAIRRMGADPRYFRWAAVRCTDLGWRGRPRLVTPLLVLGLLPSTPFYEVPVCAIRK